MDVAIPVLMVAGAIGAAVLAWAVSCRFGFLLGLVIPGLAVGGAVWRNAQALGHPEEAMGRGIEMLVFWLPFVAVTVIGAGLGLLARRRLKRGPAA